VNAPADLTADAPDATPDATLGLAVAAVAHRLGVPPATLRTWDRRYGLGPSGRSVGGHRRYTSVDLLRLDLACRLIRHGLGPGDAARLALTTDIDADAADHLTTGPTVDLLSVMPADVAASVKGLVHAAVALDSDAARRAVRSWLSHRGVINTWNNLLCPALREVGRRWELASAGIESEHLLSAVIDSELQSVVLGVTSTVNVRPVLLAAAPEDLHTLPLAALASALAERHISTRMLGAQTPADALAAAVTKVAPAAVVVWSQLESTGAADVFGQLGNARPGTVLIAAGPGWHDDLPATVVRPRDLTETVQRVTAAIR